LGALPPSAKLGKFTTVVVLPPRTSTPGTAAEPLVTVPAPPGPGVGEIPPRAFMSEPRPEPVLPAPEFSAIFSVALCGDFAAARPLPVPLP